MRKALADTPIHGDYIPRNRWRSAVFRLRRKTKTNFPPLSGQIKPQEKQTMATDMTALAKQLAAEDAAIFTTALTTARVSAGQAASLTLLATQPETLEIAQAATAPLVTQVVNAAPVMAQPLISTLFSAYLPALTENLFNDAVGQLGGSAAKQAAENAESGNGEAQPGILNLLRRLLPLALAWLARVLAEYAESRL